MSTSDASFYRWQNDALLLFCHLQPNASRSEFAEAFASDTHGARLKIRIAAPAVDGKANARLIEFLAAQFAVPKRAIEIVSGAGARQKTVRIESPRQLPPALSIAPPPATL